jgi:hypothetical protein
VKPVEPAQNSDELAEPAAKPTSAKKASITQKPAAKARGPDTPARQQEVKTKAPPRAPPVDASDEENDDEAEVKDEEEDSSQPEASEHTHKVEAEAVKAPASSRSPPPAAGEAPTPATGAANSSKMPALSTPAEQRAANAAVLAIWIKGGVSYVEAEAASTAANTASEVKVNRPPKEGKDPDAHGKVVICNWVLKLPPMLAVAADSGKRWSARHPDDARALKAVLRTQLNILSSTHDIWELAESFDIAVKKFEEFRQCDESIYAGLAQANKDLQVQLAEMTKMRAKGVYAKDESDFMREVKGWNTSKVAQQREMETAKIVHARMHNMSVRGDTTFAACIRRASDIFDTFSQRCFGPIPASKVQGDLHVLVDPVRVYQDTMFAIDKYFQDLRDVKPVTEVPTFHILAGSVNDWWPKVYEQAELLFGPVREYVKRLVPGAVAERMERKLEIFEEEYLMTAEKKREQVERQTAAKLARIADYELRQTQADMSKCPFYVSCGSWKKRKNATCGERVCAKRNRARR